MTDKEPQEFRIEALGGYNLNTKKFIFSQAEKMLDDTIKNFDQTSLRATSLSTLIMAIFSVEVGYVFSNFNTSGTFDLKLFSVIITTCFTFFIIWKLAYIFKPTEYKFTGSLPASFTHQELAELELDGYVKKELELELYDGQIQEYNKRINHNLSTNETRQEILLFSIRGILFSPVIYMLLYFVGTWFISLC